MKRIGIVGLLLVLILTGIYLTPVQHRPFEYWYRENDGTVERLSRFRSLGLQYFDQDGTGWHYYLSPIQGGPVLLLLHGMGGAYDIWWQQILPLEQHFTVVSLTLPGVSSLQQAAAGIIKIMDRHAFETFSVMGTSMGGHIAQYLIQQHPDRIEKAILGNTFVPHQDYHDRYQPLQRKMALLPDWYVMRQFRKNYFANVSPASAYSPLVAAHLMELYSGVLSKKDYLARMSVVMDRWEPGHQAVVQLIPKLIILSDNDPLIAPWMRKLLRETYPDAVTYTFHEMGHFPYLNAPETYTDIVLRFLIYGEEGSEGPEHEATIDRENATSTVGGGI